MLSSAARPGDGSTGGVHITIKHRWRLQSKIGQGAFGHTFSAVDLQNGQQVAVKLEDISTNAVPSDAGAAEPQHEAAAPRRQVLKLEVAVLKKLQASAPEHFCRYFGCGRTKLPSRIFTAPLGTNFDGVEPSALTKDGEWRECNFLVMQLLADNLSELRRQQPHQHFSTHTVAKWGRQMLSAIQAVHSHGYLHRDIKPSNFVMGTKKDDNDEPTCYLIDFGLARRFITASGKLREARPSAGFRGTARYASIEAHQGNELGPRDDLMSLFYVLVEFYVGSLPWRKEKDRAKVLPMKQQWAEDLLAAVENNLIVPLPRPLVDFLLHLNSLPTLESMPDYAQLQLVLGRLLQEDDLFGAVPFDWTAKPPAAIGAENINSMPQDPLVTPTNSPPKQMPPIRQSAPQRDTLQPIPPTTAPPKSKGFLYRLRRLNKMARNSPPPGKGAV